MNDENQLDRHRQHYDKWAPRYDKVAKAWQYHFPEKIANKLKKYLNGSGKMIDLACGTGLNSLYYKKIKVGVDLSLNMLKEAKKKNYKYLIEADIKNLPLKDNQFDYLLCISVLEIFDELQEYIKEMKRITKPNGIITFTSHCGAHSKKELERVIDAEKLEVKEFSKFLSHFEDREKVYCYMIIASNKK